MGKKLSLKQLTFYEILCLSVLWVLLLLVPGCMANFGSMERSQKINEVFESYQVLPNYNYYYTGGQNNPKAIMGIHKDYNLKTSSWTLMDSLTSDTLKKRVDGMTNEGQGLKAYGWVIFSPNGEKVGVWYSMLDQTTVKFGDNKEIFVSQPNWEDPDERMRLKLP
jgi:hypothetical protein